MHYKESIKKTTALLFVFIFVLSICFSTPSLAASVEDYKRQSDDLGKEIASKNNELKSIKKKNKDNETYLSTLTARMDLIRQSIDVLQGQIDTLRTQIKEKENSIAALEDQIAEKQKLFDEKKAEYMERLRVLYMSGGVTNLEVLMSGGDFSSLLTRAQLVSSVSKQDQKALEALEKTMEEIKKDQAALVADKETLLSAKAEQDKSMADLQSQKDALAADVAEGQAAAHALQSQKKTIETEIEESAEEQAALKKRINAILYPPRPNGSISDKPIITPGDGNTTGQMVHPCPGRDYVSVYWPKYSNGNWHGGVDFACGKRSPDILAADGGIVVEAGWSNTGYGNYVMIYHSNGLFTLYGHASALYVSPDQMVTKGQKIGSVGSTGNSSGNHLHFEVRHGDGSSNRDTYNPASYLPYL